MYLAADIPVADTHRSCSLSPVNIELPIQYKLDMRIASAPYASISLGSTSISFNTGHPPDTNHDPA